MKATAEQKACLAAFNDGGSLKIEATAGSGKTTTQRYLVHYGALYGRALYTSFGKKNIDDAKAKFPKSRIKVMTNHGLAYGRCGSMFARAGRLDRLPSPQNLATLMGWNDATFSPHVKLVTGAHFVLATLHAFMASADEAVTEQHALPHVATKGSTPSDVLQLARRVAEHARDLWHRLIHPTSVLPISHDVYLKLFALGRPQLGFKHIFLDEAQDTTDVMIGLLQSQEDCQLTLVGDRYQQLYSWRGAINAMDRFDTDSYATLTQSFRFGPAVADVANAVLGGFLNSSIRVIGFPELPSRVERVADPFCIIARSNATLFGELVAMAAAEPGARLAVVGGVKEMEDLVNGAASLQRGERTHVSDLKEFSHWGQVVSIVKEEDGYRHLAPLVTLVETYGCPGLLAVLARVKGNEHDESSCRRIFTTAHKSKGREFPTVRLCDDFNPPPADPEKRRHWNPEEANILYVAVTRAQQALDITHCSAAQQAMDIARFLHYARTA